MTNKEIKSAIRNCYWRDDCLNGKHKDDRYVICRGYCLPCLKVIDDGKCDTLIELFKAESEGMDRKTLGEDICECGHHFPKGKYDFCPICGSEFGIIDRYRNEVSS